MQMAQLLIFTDIKLVHKFTHSKGSMYSLNRTVSPVNPHPTFANEFAKPTLSSGEGLAARRRNLPDKLKFITISTASAATKTAGKIICLLTKHEKNGRILYYINKFFRK